MMAMMGMGAGEPFVLTQLVEERDISPAQSYIGQVEALNSVDLRPQVVGIVEKVLFQEGSIVNEGDILFIIEQRRYLANLDLRQAELRRAKAHLTRVEKDYNRQVELNRQRFVSESQLENAHSDLLQARAVVKQAEANVELAQIDLDYTVIKAPFTGRIGIAFITEGNFVSSPAQVLAHIVQLDPIRISFAVSDRDFLTYRDVFQNSKTANFSARIILPDGSTLQNPVISHYTANVVNPQTATMTVFAEFDNKNHVLTPGNFVNILVSTKDTQKAAAVPQGAIGRDEHGVFVYVVDEENTVHQRRIVPGNLSDGKQIVLNGLNKGEQIVIQGLQRVRPGIKVRPNLVISGAE
jgi:RND family efflux transporter MFP subunit